VPSGSTKKKVFGRIVFLWDGKGLVGLTSVCACKWVSPRVRITLSERAEGDCAVGIIVRKQEMKGEIIFLLTQVAGYKTARPVKEVAKQNSK